MIQLTDQDVQGLATVSQARDYVERALTDFSVGKADILQRTRVDCGATKLSTMGAIWAAQDFSAVKSYLTVNGAFSFSITGWNTQSNEVMFTMSGQEVTRLRTPALALLAIQGAARSDSQKFTLFGAGFQGRVLAESLLELGLASDLYVVDVRDVSDWCFDISNRYNCRVQQQTPEFAVDNADVIITTTRSKSPLFDGSRVRPGTTIIAMGTSLPNATELDLWLLQRASRLIVEWRPQSLVEAGEVRLLLEASPEAIGKVVDLKTLFTAQEKWRRSDDEIIVFKSVGVGLCDTAVSLLLWRLWRLNADASDQSLDPLVTCPLQP